MAAVDVGLGGRPALNARIVRIAASLVRPADGSLHVVHAWSIAAESVLTCPVRGLGRARVSALRRWTRAERLRRLEALVAAEACGRRVHVILEHGRPGSVVRRTALRVGAELVVIGAVHPPCWPGMVIGSMAEALAGGVDYSVLLVRSGDVAPDTRAASTP